MPVWKKILIVVITVVALIAYACGLLVYSDYKHKTADKDLIQEDAQIETETVDEVELTENEEVYHVDIEKIREEYANDDIYAWIKVDGTEIDYPILESTQDDYYLEHTVEGEAALPGAIYTNAIDGKDFNRSNTIVYGHNMKNGTYFGALREYRDAEYLKAHKRIEITLNNRMLVYEIIAAGKFSDAYLPDKYALNMSLGAEQFMNDFLSYDSENTVADIDNKSYVLGDWQQILTLSTCVSGEDDKRFLVVGRLVDVKVW